MLAVLTAFVVVLPQAASAGGGSVSGSYEFESPLFGLAAKGGSLFVADGGAGVVRLRNGNGKLIAELPGVTDVAPIDHTSMYAVTGAPDRRLYRITDGVVSRVAYLGRFEANVNPDGGEIDSNPFDVAALPGGRALVADAAANALLIVKADGTVDWVATLPEQLEHQEPEATRRVSRRRARLGVRLRPSRSDPRPTSGDERRRRP